MPASANASTDWDLIVTPDHGIGEMDFAELRRYRDLLWLFIRRDFVAFYKQTLLGPLWIFIQPLLTSLVFLLVFHRIAGLPTDNIPPILFYLIGVSCWSFFADCMLKTSETFTANATLFEKVYFPRLISPLSAVVASSIRLAVQLGLFVLLWIWYWSNGTIAFGWSIAVVPLLIALLATIALGFGLLFAALTSKYRDLRLLLQFGMQLLMFATPVIYPLSIASSGQSRLLSFNPLTPIFESIRFALFGTGSFSLLGLIGSITFAIVFLIVGMSIFQRVERTFVDSV